MPQLDRRRSRMVPIEFEATETLIDLPNTDRVSFVLVTDGKANIVLNNSAIAVIAPCVLCLSPQDTVQVIDNNWLFAQSFNLSPDFLKTRFTFKQIRQGKVTKMEEEHRRDMLMLFFMRSESYHGVINLPPQIYQKLFEWLSIIGTEIAAQSDGLWTCRVRRYFLQILNLLDDVYENKEKASDFYAEGSAVDVVMEYIHTHYMDETTLGMLCGLTHVNRTTLNKMFKEWTGQTVIEYLLNYRFRTAQELLAHTGLTIEEIARTTGFTYGTYLIRQFTARTGQTPTEYRQEAREKHGIVIRKM